MAKPVKFGTKPAAKKAFRRDTSFNFGFNTLSKTAARAYNRKIGKTGHKPGGGS